MISFADITAFAAKIQPAEEPVYWLVNHEIEHQLRSATARWKWHNWYRAARTLGNRELAVERVGERRRDFREQ